MDVLAIVCDALNRNDEITRHNGEALFDLSDKHIIRSIYASYEKPYIAGEQCAVIIDVNDCQVAGFYFYNFDIDSVNEVVHLEDYPKVDPRIEYIYNIICRELIHGRNN